MAGTDSRIGTEIAGHRIERLLGRGGMGVVYLALLLEFLESQYVAVCW